MTGAVLPAHDPGQPPVTATARTRCAARFSLHIVPLGERIWCMDVEGHSGRHWARDTYYEIYWDDRIAFRPWEPP